MQLQRGFQVFHQVCASCHGLKYVAFRSLGREDGPNFPEEQVKAIAAEYQVPDTDTDDPGDTRARASPRTFPRVNDDERARSQPDGQGAGGLHGPYGTGINQLSRAWAAPEYIYSLLTGYTGEDRDGGRRHALREPAFAGGSGSAWPQPLYGDDVDTPRMATGSGYTPPEATIEQQSKDVAAFLMWTAEPKMTERKEAGFRNLIWLIILSVLLYYTNKAIWKPIKGDH